jgi:hypothetical protein
MLRIPRCWGLRGQLAAELMGTSNPPRQAEAFACDLACVVAGHAGTADIRPQAVDGARRRRAHVAHQGGASIALATHSCEPRVDQGGRYHVEIGVVFGGEPRPIARIRAARAAGLACWRFAVRGHGDRSKEGEGFRRTVLAVIRPVQSRPGDRQLSEAFAQSGDVLDPLACHESLSNSAIGFTSPLPGKTVLASASSSSRRWSLSTPFMTARKSVVGARSRPS